MLGVVRMSFDELVSSKWFLLLISIIVPLILLAVAMIFNAHICVMIVLLVWIGSALLMLYLPMHKE
ncbi:MAG: hypothetical protein GX307_03540 [Euryarchaeota archaeon]|nr:hypothetical protein [Euryarchaeota archaeon]